MTDHIRRRHNLKTFVSILAATLTTVGALSIIFFLDDKLRLDLQDFAVVVIVNLFVALFFVPAMIQKIGLSEIKKNVMIFWIKRQVVLFTHLYIRWIEFFCRYRVMACILLVLAFGLPVFLLPEKMNGDGKFAEYYNKVFANSTYKEKVKPIVDKTLGGTLRLFVDKVYTGSYFNREKEETVLSVYASLPNGSTLEQMNTLIKKMETYLSEFKEIKQFQTSIYSARRASIQIYFRKEHQHSDFPYTLKANVISKVLQLGGGHWEVYGLQDQGFSNSMRESAGNFRVKMYGYNYDELAYWGEKLKEKLLTHRRIKEVTINSEFSWYKDDYNEFYLDLDKHRLAKESITGMQLFNALRTVFGRNITCANIVYGGQPEMLKLNSRQSGEYDVWSLANIPFEINGHSYKLADFAKV